MANYPLQNDFLLEKRHRPQKKSARLVKKIIVIGTAVFDGGARQRRWAGRLHAKTWNGYLGIAEKVNDYGAL